MQKYAKKMTANDKMMAIGMDRFGFFASSPAVAMQSNPMKPVYNRTQ